MTRHYHYRSIMEFARNEGCSVYVKRNGQPFEKINPKSIDWDPKHEYAIIPKEFQQIWDWYLVGELEYRCFDDKEWTTWPINEKYPHYSLQNNNCVKLRKKPKTRPYAEEIKKWVDNPNCSIWSKNLNGFWHNLPITSLIKCSTGSKVCVVPNEWKKVWNWYLAGELQILTNKSLNIWVSWGAFANHHYPNVFTTPLDLNKDLSFFRKLP